MAKIIRPIRIEGNVAYITLTKGYEAIIDASDVPLVEGWSWNACVKEWTVYAVRTDRTGPKQRLIRMHRVIMDDPAGFEIDHINSDGLNNQRKNLRVATKSQNLQNRRISKANTSGFKGVTWNKQSRRWRAYIRLFGTTYYLGSFVDPEAAHASYSEASARLHGEFGRVA